MKPENPNYEYRESLYRNRCENFLRRIAGDSPVPRVIQNAVYIVGEDLFLVSTHVHDYRQWTSKDGKDHYAVDGGTEYIRRGYSSAALETNGKVIDYTLTTNSSWEEIRDKMLWGSIKSDKRIFRPLKSLELSHLENILRTQKQIFGTVQEVVVEYWANVKTGNPSFER